MTARTRNMILSTLRAMGDDVDEQIVLDCGHPYVMGKIREMLKLIEKTPDIPKEYYENIALYAIYGVHLCNLKLSE